MTDKQLKQKVAQVLREAKRKGLKVLTPDLSFDLDDTLNHEICDTVADLMGHGGAFRTVSALGEYDVCLLGGMSPNDEALDAVSDSLDHKGEHVFEAPKKTKHTVQTLVFQYKD
jgi:hypothetical protein